MTGPSANRGGHCLLTALVSFVKLVLEGSTPPFVRSFFFGATLIAVEKKVGGIRPIAVGGTLRRLVAKVAGAKVMAEMGALLAPRQLGYGMKGGCEAAVHSARLYLDNLLEDHAILKLDFKTLLIQFGEIPCWKLFMIWHQLFFLLSTQPTPHHPPSFGAANIYSLPKECSREILWDPYFSAYQSTSFVPK